MLQYDMSGLTERFRDWRPNRFQEKKSSHSHVYLPCLSPSAAVATPPFASLSSQPQSPSPARSASISSSPAIDQCAISVQAPAISVAEEAEESRLDDPAPLPTASPTEKPEEPLVSVIRYARSDLFALRQSPHVCCPDGFADIAAEIKSITDKEKLALQNGGRKNGANPKKNSNKGPSHQPAPVKTRVLEIVNSTLVKSGHGSSGKVAISQAKMAIGKAVAPQSVGNNSLAHMRCATEENDAPQEEVDDDEIMKHIIADMEAAEAEQKARIKAKKQAVEITTKVKGGVSDDRGLFAQLSKNAQLDLPAEVGDSGTATPQSEPAALPVQPMAEPQSDLAEATEVFATDFHCGRCEHYFKSSIHLRLHFEMSAVHNVCEVCEKDLNSWKGLLLHHKVTGHAVV